ncbi:hypothetical protein CRENBAI_007594 [Crenichthys baileyi]|uniref:Uncharacterized protein n=1 Tax=Crenichthys baileyi TaxID=28760 RepID=A0AAV9S8R0_9TELE
MGSFQQFMSLCLDWPLFSSRSAKRVPVRATNFVGEESFKIMKGQLVSSQSRCGGSFIQNTSLNTSSYKIPKNPQSSHIIVVYVKLFDQSYVSLTLTYIFLAH